MLHKHTNAKHGDMATNSKENISKSIKQQKSPIFYCDGCEHSSKNKKGLKEHKEKNHQAHECSICGVSFVEEINLTEHLKEEHMIYSNSLTCSYNKCTEDEVCDEWKPKGDETNE